MENSSATNDIISYIEMCNREGCSLQRGMNFRLSATHSVILMSQRKNAPYEDRLSEDSQTLIYEGHDIPKTKDITNPKLHDQPECFPSGKLTQNGLFLRAAQDYKSGNREVEPVHVYEKILPGIWAFTGKFYLINAWKEKYNNRKVFKFELTLHSDQETISTSYQFEKSSSRIIPTSVKMHVWKRDGGKCVICGATTELHFDHILPYSKGGTSTSAENIQILCARHNIQKSNKIE